MGKNKKVVPLFGMDGKIDWVSEMMYRCTKSKEGDDGCTCNNIPTSDPNFTKLLPPAISAAYPVDPRFIKKSFHLTKNLTHWLRTTTITYLSAGMFAKMLNEHINSGYVDEVKNYVDLCLANGDDDDDDNNDDIPPYPNQFERAGAFSPSGD